VVTDAGGGTKFVLPGVKAIGFADAHLKHDEAAPKMGHLDGAYQIAAVSPR
jgi:hypothetical protein